MVSITLTEIIPKDKLYDLSLCSSINEEEKTKIQKLFNKIIKSNGVNTVEYVYKNRLTAKGCSLQYLSRKVRSYLCKGELTDLDMKACAINILWNIVSKYNNIFYSNELDFINKLRFKRDEIIKDIIDTHSITEKEAKVELNKLLFGDTINVDWISTDELRLFNSIKSKVANMKELKYIKDNIKKDVYNYEGKRLAQIIFKIEAQIVECAVSYLTNKRYKIETIIFDGFHIRNERFDEPAITQDEINELQEHIKSNLEMETEWVIKDFEDTDSLVFETNTPIVPEIKEGLDQIIFDKFLKWTKINNLLRLKDKCITLKVINAYHAEPIYLNVDKTINAFIEQSKANYLFKNAKIGKFRNMLRDFIVSNQPDDDFPVVDISWKYFGYSNGLFDIVSNKFITENFEDGILCRKYFDEPFEPLTTLPTMLNKIYKDQNWDDETIELCLVMLGRAYFRIKTLDEWGVFPCFVGTSSTGKSTSIDRVMKNNNDVKTLDTKKSSFNLEGLENTDLLVVEEAENLNVRLDIEQYKSMPRGEITTINGKNKTQIHINWTTPVILSSNNPLNYDDKSKAVANRTVYFKFQTIIDNKDPKIKAQLEKDDPKILPYLIGKYHEYLSKNTEVLVLGEQIQSWNESLNNENDDFYNWINGVSDDLYWCIKYEEGSSVSINEFKDKWKKHWTMGLKKKSEAPNIGIHEEALLGKLGINKKEIKVCRYCENRHLKGCCEKYERTHRKTKVVFTNCAFEAGKLNYRDYQPKNRSENKNTCEVAEEEEV